MSTPDTTGGGPIWGINGVAIVCHGASRSDHIAAAIGVHLSENTQAGFMQLDGAEGIRQGVHGGLY